MLLAVDAYSIIHRAYHAYPPNLVTKDGTLVNAVYGFTSMLLDVLIKYNPDHVVVAFDSHGPTFRQDIYVDYKGNRGQTDEELTNQIPLVKEVVQALNIPAFEQKGVEADDILGTVSKLAQKEKNKDVLIVSGDRDMLQLVNSHVSVLLPRGSFKNLEVFHRAKVEEYWGVQPEQIVDLKALMGDASDNIPGVRGIGPKTAQQLINQYESLEGIYEHIADITGRTQKLLVDGHELAVVSQKLARIKTDVPLQFDLQACVLTDFNYEEAVAAFQQFEFKSLLSKLQKVARVTPQKVKATPIPQVSLFQKEKTEWRKSGVADFDERPVIKEVATVSPADWGKDWEGTAKSGQSLLVAYTGEAVKLFSIEGKVWDGAILSYGWTELLRAVARDPSDEAWLVAQETLFAKLDQKQPLVDYQLLNYAYLTGRGDYDLEGLAWDSEAESVESAWIIIQNICQTLAEVQALPTNKSAADRWKQLSLADLPMLNMVSRVDAPMAVGIAALERNGIRLDLSQVELFKHELEATIKKLEKAIYEEVGHEFNIRSTQQLGTVLFSELGIPPKRKTKTGYSTDDTVLQELKVAHPVVALVIDYRMHYKLYSTYVLPFLQYKPDQNDSQAVRLHSTFNQIASATGRLSSINPNLQNLPIRTEVGQKIRTFFTVPADRMLVSIDYSQIDLRVMAEMSRDKQLITDFNHDLDIHRATASKMFDVAYDQVNDAQRRVAKTINFGVIYGISPFGLATNLQIDYHKAEEYINQYFEKYPGIAEYVQKTITFVSQHGYVEGLLGRRRQISGIESNNGARRNAAIREAINMPIQGGSDDIMRLALIGVQQKILAKKEWRGQVKLVLQIHDELVFETPNDQKLIESFSKDAQQIMEHVLRLAVPLKTGTEVGSHL